MFEITITIISLAIIAKGLPYFGKMRECEKNIFAAELEKQSKLSDVTKSSTNNSIQKYS